MRDNSLDRLRQAAIAEEQCRKKMRKKKQNEMKVSYGTDGKKLRKGLGKKSRNAIVVIIGFIVLWAVIYIPAILYKEPVIDSGTEGYKSLISDNTALKTYPLYVKDNPDEDFDKDGISNSKEDEYGTDIWKVDTDNDGVSDYAELFLTETSPTQTSTVLMDAVMKRDNDEKVSLKTPYAIDNITLWPDDYRSKAYGAVVRSVSGYRFWNYKGWVQFPDKGYAYYYRNGRHYEIPYRKMENAWYIDSSSEVRVYDRPVTYMQEFKIPFIDAFFFEDTGVWKLIGKFLPDAGSILNCRRVALEDYSEKCLVTKIDAIDLPQMDFTDLSRFGVCHNTLKDMATVRKYIEAGRCLGVSFFSESSGEAIGIVYGYTSEGDILIAGANDLLPAGTLKITPCAIRSMNQSGVIGVRSWYEFTGLGYNSISGDRIYFFY